MEISVDLLSLPGARDMMDDDDVPGVFIPYEPNLHKSVSGGRQHLFLRLVNTYLPENKKTDDVMYGLRLEVPNEHQEKFFRSPYRVKAKQVGYVFRSIHDRSGKMDANTFNEILKSMKG